MTDENKTLNNITTRAAQALRPPPRPPSGVPAITTITVDTGWSFRLEPKAARLALSLLAYLGEPVPPTPPPAA